MQSANGYEPASPSGNSESTREVAALLIRYAGSQGVTERRIRSPIRVTDWQINAFCELRGAERTFDISSIEHAVDLTTGEVVSDLEGWLDAHATVRPFVVTPPSGLLASTSLPETQPDSSSKAPRERYRGQRSREKSQFQSYYRLRSIYELYRDRLFAAFGDRCFKCNAPGPLVLDHHVPLALSGHTQPGNFVALCRRCNGRKLDNPPERFYNDQELARVAPLLAAQPALMAFRFNRTRFDSGRRKYLLEIGLAPATVDRIFSDPEHRDYMEEFVDQGASVSVTVSIEIGADGMPTVRTSR
jgi:hypothetical protein